MNKFSTIGCDPEFLLQCRDTGCLVSAEGYIPGTKTDPYPVRLGSVQLDNVAAEFNTVPVHSGREFSLVVRDVYGQVLEMVEEHGLTSADSSVGEFEQTEHNIIAGCDPDWNAYTLRLNQPPDYVNTKLRAVGGHVHIGTDVDRDNMPLLVRALDLFVTVPMLAYEDKRRRSMYGQAGSFRLKDYGVEYRTPSNLWIFSDDSIRWMYEQVEKAIKSFQMIALPLDLQTIIDHHQLDRIGTLMEEYACVPFPIYPH